MADRTGTRALAAVAALSWGGIMVLAAFVPRAFGPYDGAYYLAMADHPGGYHPPPWSYRILTPDLVRLLPLPHLWGFWLVTVLALGAAAFLCGLLCRAAALPPWSAYVGALLFLCSYATMYDLSDYRLIDPLAYAGTALVCLALLRGWWALAVLALLLTTLDKEWGVLIVPVFLMGGRWRIALSSRHARWSLLLAVTGAPLLFLVVRVLVGLTPYGEYAASFTQSGLTAPSAPRVLDATLLAFGPLLPLAVWGWRTASQDARSLWPLVPAAYVQLLFASDTPRMLTFALPALIPLATGGLVSLASRVAQRQHGSSPAALALVPAPAPADSTGAPTLPPHWAAPER